MKKISMIFLLSLAFSANASLSHFDDFTKTKSPYFWDQTIRNPKSTCSQTEKSLYNLLPSYVKFDFARPYKSQKTAQCNFKYFKWGRFMNKIILSIIMFAFVNIANASTGIASWYGPGFQGKKTASGEKFNQYALTAAHKSLPLGSRVRVTNLATNDSVIVRINDRGPYVHGRIIDLSKGAAQAIGIHGTGKVSITRLD